MRRSASPVVPGRPGRRSVVLGVAGLLTGSLAGCSVRLEDDAPAIPLVPTRESVPAENALLWLLADSRRLSLSTRSAVYQEQVAVLRSALHRAGIPIETLDGAIAGAGGSTSATETPAAQPSATRPSAAQTSATQTSATQTSATQTSATLTSASPSASAPPASPGAALDRIEELRRCGPGVFPVVMSLLAQRWAAVTIAGEPLPEPMLEEGSGRIWRYPALAREFAVLTQPAVYALEVVSAQSRDDSREVAIEALSTLRLLAREQDVRAAGTTPPPDLGYALPFRVDSEESAAALARHVLATLLSGYGALLSTVTGSAQEDAARDVVTWIGSVSWLGQAWGLAPQAFPGTGPGA
ncbi:DUF4439 domain-containing protein [Nostocoides sp. F2B08]|uniref:DUF4439 domain-containing protein n=1 Tax=Nostocoides sp. F2B08 TaxID=2653936 RepID=UPI0013286046|nr:DUF4439 domain-containing protein [Tetrasphaera sp. F2B08]KAB7746008.1 DUF4439 domain-containing protein [Tetrasphaera sp. F2B08]